MKDKCPTCGSDVIVCGEGSTHFYVPLQKDKETLKKIVREALVTVQYQDEQWNDEDTMNLIVNKIYDNDRGK
jgi:hypothetical protein